MHNGVASFCFCNFSSAEVIQFFTLLRSDASVATSRYNVGHVAIGIGDLGLAYQVTEYPLLFRWMLAIQKRQRNHTAVVKQRRTVLLAWSFGLGILNSCVVMRCLNNVTQNTRCC